MQVLEWKWYTKDGLKMYSKAWAPEKPKAVVCVVHGHGEHIGRYEHVGVALAEKGYVVAGYDLRGHGKSGGARGHTPTFDALLDDIDAFITWMEGRYVGIPRFLFGHSLGGNMVLNRVLRGGLQLNGVIVTAPVLRLAFDPPKFKVFMGKLMDKIIPDFTQASGLETGALSHDQEVVRAYGNDPLVHDRITARMFTGMMASGAWVMEHAAKFPLPLLLMNGTNDRIVSTDAVKEFAARAGAKVTFRLWEGWYHELHNEPGKAQVFKVMTDWMDEHL